MDLKITDDVEIRNSEVFVGPERLANCSFLKLLGSGANGVVLLIENTLMGRKEAVKIWLKMRSGDNRDKVIQGINEIKKMVAASTASKFVAQVYFANNLGNKLISHMEFIDGMTLGQTLATSIPHDRRLHLANLYIESIRQTSELVIHGDPHKNNVMIYEFTKKYGQETRIKLLDFGTSYFAGQDFSEKRHWQIVEETFDEILRSVPEYAKVRSHYRKSFGHIAEPEVRLGNYVDVIRDLGNFLQREKA